MEAGNLDAMLFGHVEADEAYVGGVRSGGKRGRGAPGKTGVVGLVGCAPVAVAAACGLHVSRLDGALLISDSANVYMPDLLICRKEIAGAALAAVEAFVDAAKAANSA